VFYIDISPSNREIKLVTPTGVTVVISNDGQVTVTSSSNINVTCPALNVDANVNIQGFLTVSQYADVQGDVIGGEVKVRGNTPATLSTHRHNETGSRTLPPS